ncbi:MAG: hypothetical protein KME60_08570 [Cyanomargarita calcarea GSE-NOS-MK-12-04C]|jgi:hypothetical protein|uniref:Uncharacterized protein n=1 Tax=Cyanomargarita calcarea GSE-NOS-MK-12-04C TaxID=2839659 RepID=A0A951US18_9CYAN|nr:hypothetical protein [Cyanomargarita calcarea GSE-NOS-MK-12-04C]
MKSSVYRNATVAACSFGLLWLLSGCYQVSVSFEPSQPETVSELSDPSKGDFKTSLPKNGISSTVISTADSNSKETNKPLLAYSQDSSQKAAQEASLRMSNQTNQPVRLALLARRTRSNSHIKSSKSVNNDIPAHWDFSPQEGSEQGLILSLPKGNLKLEKGDILVAFAQDGSRRYWGPFVVGETTEPNWNAQHKEWQLILSQ